MGYPHWGNKHLVDVDLSAAFLLFGLSISYDWLKDDLTPEEKQLLEDKVVLQANRMFDFKLKTQGEGWSTAYFQNHNWINMTGLATAGYALREKYPEMQKMIDDAAENFDLVMDLMPDDGSDYEGVVYWRYGVIWLYIYAHLAKVEGKKDHFKTCNFLRETFFYRLYQAVPNLEEIVNYGDCHDKKSGHSLAMYYKIAAEYNNGYAQEMGDIVSQNFVYREQYESKVKPGILPETGLELLWYNPKVEAKPFNELATTRYFEDLGLVVLRDSWEKDAFHYSFKCGMPGGTKQFHKCFEINKTKKKADGTPYKVFGLSHQHPDNTAFHLHAHDTYLAIDEGYNRTVKACEHNVVTVDGKGYRDEGQNNVWHQLKEEYTAETRNFTQENGVSYFVGSTPKMYVDELQLTQYNRHVFYAGSNYVFTVDELGSELDHEYKYHLHTETLSEDDGNFHFSYENGPGGMQFFVNSTEELAYDKTFTYVKAIMTTQEPDVFREVNMNTLNIWNKTKAKTANFMTLMKTDAAFSPEEFTVNRINEGNVVGLELVRKDGTDVLLYSPEAVEYKGKKYDSKFVFIHNGSEFLPKGT